MSCKNNPSDVVADGILWGDVLNSDNPIDCGGTYFRPDVGGSLMPWMYLGLLIIIQAPTAFRRVAKWKNVQALALGLTVFHEFIIIQAYESTRLAPEKILVWAPLTLLIDAGAMMQLIVLLAEHHGSNLPILGRWVKDKETFPETQWLNPNIFGISHDRHGKLHPLPSSHLLTFHKQMRSS